MAHGQQARQQMQRAAAPDSRPADAAALHALPRPPSTAVSAPDSPPLLVQVPPDLHSPSHQQLLLLDHMPGGDDPASGSANVDVATMDRDELQDAVTRAYSRLTRKELILLLTLRTLPVHGDHKELAFRLAVHDLSHRTDINTPRIHTPPPSNDISFLAPHPPEPPSTISTAIAAAESTDGPASTTSNPDERPHHIPYLPAELWAEIFEFVADWELATALGIRTALRPASDWAGSATPLDRALLSGSIPYVCSFLARHPSLHKFTKFGARALVRFAYTDLLTFLHHRFPDEFRVVFTDPGLQIPMLASRLGQTKVLEWWLAATEPDGGGSNSGGGGSGALTFPPLPRDYDEKPLDEASRKGHIHVLQWWKQSGLPLRYGLVMDVASSAGQISVLEWWKNSGLPIEYRHALRIASWKGEVGVLEWWKRSGLRLIYDKECLVEATKFNRVEVLEWWLRSGLRIEYVMFDIEGALEDAIGGGEEARKWWAMRGVRFDVGVKEWMEYKVLAP